MKISKRDPLTGRTNTMDLPITEEQLQRWKQGEMAQLVFPNLSKNEREFLISGFTPESWDKMFKGQDHDLHGNR